MTTQHPGASQAAAAHDPDQEKQQQQQQQRCCGLEPPTETLMQHLSASQADLSKSSARPCKRERRQQRQCIVICAESGANASSKRDSASRCLASSTQPCERNQQQQQQTVNAVHAILQVSCHGVPGTANTLLPKASASVCGRNMVARCVSFSASCTRTDGPLALADLFPPFSLPCARPVVTGLAHH
jgi:hypothetical protein